MTEQADAALRGVGDGEVVELEICGVFCVRGDDTLAVAPGEAIGAGVAVNDADEAGDVVLRGVARVVFAHLHEAHRVHFKAAIGELIDVGSVVGEEVGWGEGLSFHGGGFAFGKTGEPGFHGHGAIHGAICGMVDAGTQGIDDPELVAILAVCGDVTDDPCAVCPEVKAGAAILKPEGDDLDGMPTFGESADGELRPRIRLVWGANGEGLFPRATDAARDITDVFFIALRHRDTHPDAPLVGIDGFDGAGEVLHPSADGRTLVAELFTQKFPGRGGDKARGGCVCREDLATGCKGESGGGELGEKVATVLGRGHKGNVKVFGAADQPGSLVTVS